MKKIIISIICGILSLTMIAGCGGTGSGNGGGGGNKVTVSFVQSGATVKEITISKGKTISASDLPVATSTNANFNFEWAIDVTKPILEDKRVETVKYSKGVKLATYKSGQYKVTGWDETVKPFMPAVTYLPTYYKGGVVTNIDSKAFYISHDQGASYMPSSTLEEVIFPEFLETISPEAFKNCKALKTVKFPSTLKQISSGAFASCPLEVIEFNEGLESIGTGAFHPRCRRMVIPEGIKILEAAVFASTHIREFVLPKSLTEVKCGGIWPVDTHPLEKIYYAGDYYDWMDLYDNISEEQTSAMVNIPGKVDVIAPEDGRERRSSKDAVDWAVIYIYSEEEPEFNYDHEDNKYWHYGANGEIEEWPDPVE